MWMTLTMAGREQNLANLCEKLMKNVDIEEPTSFLDHVYLECTQHECEQNDFFLEKIQKYVRITYFCLSNGKIAGMGKITIKSFCMVLRCGSTCTKMRGTYCELATKKDRAIP